MLSCLALDDMSRSLVPRIPFNEKRPLRNYFGVTNETLAVILTVIRCSLVC